MELNFSVLLYEMHLKLIVGKGGIVGLSEKVISISLEHYLKQNKITPKAEAPVQKFTNDIYLKRGDLYTIFDTNGFKAKQGYHLILSEIKKRTNGEFGVVTAGSRFSPQIYIVSNIAHHLGLPCRVHTSIHSEVSGEVFQAGKTADVIGHAWVRKTYIVSKAKTDAEYRNWIYIPFGMGSHEAVRIIEPEVLNIPKGIKTILISLGSGMNCSGLINGLETFSSLYPHLKNIEIVGVGNKDNNPMNNIKKYSVNPNRVKPFSHNTEYRTEVNCSIGNIELDPYYESKVWDWYLENSHQVKHPIIFWIIGKRTHNGIHKIKPNFYSETHGNLAPYQERFLQGET